MAQGPLVGVKVVEFAGIGPGPFCGMLLADMGADVVRIDRAEGRGFPDLANRGKRSIALDLKKAEGVEAALSLIDQADALLEGFRPGVMERLGVGPDVALKRNPKLVYGRMTGWGQTGPWSSMAGHDIDYIALTGALHTMGRKGEPPAPPLNLVGDFGGGALYLAMGLLAGIIEARTSGKGQVVDCAMIDGAASLMTMFYGMKAAGMWSPERDSNLLDGGAHFYDTYECADGQWLAIGSIEPQFHALLVKGLGLPDDAFGGGVVPLCRGAVGPAKHRGAAALACGAVLRRAGRKALCAAGRLFDRHEAAPADRPLADQRTRAAVARRNHQREVCMCS